MRALSSPLEGLGHSSWMLKALCATGAKMDAKELYQRTPLAFALGSVQGEIHRGECVRVLLVNGARLAMVRGVDQSCVEPWMVALERGCGCCRTLALAGIEEAQCHARPRSLGGARNRPGCVGDQSGFAVVTRMRMNVHEAGWR